MSTYLINTSKLEAIIPEYQMFLNGEGIKYIRDKKKTNDFLKVYLFEYDAIDSLDRETLKELINKLWAFNNCTDKEFILNEFLRSGILNIKNNFKYLFNENVPLSERFDAVNKNLKMFDEVAISELLSHFRENKYAILSNKTINSMAYLEVPKNKIPGNLEVKGKEYEVYCQTLYEVLNEINKIYPWINNMSYLENLLFFMSVKNYINNEDSGMENTPSVQTQVEKTSLERNISTNEQIDKNLTIKQVLQLGSELGFEVDKNVSITNELKIDAVWKNKIANLVITYAFEVFDKESNIKTKARKIAELTRFDSSVQKVIIISKAAQFENLKEKLVEYNVSKNLVSHFDIKDLQKALNHLEGLKEILDELGLLQFNN